MIEGISVLVTLVLLAVQVRHAQRIQRALRNYLTTPAGERWWQQAIGYSHPI